MKCVKEDLARTCGEDLIEHFKASETTKTSNHFMFNVVLKLLEFRISLDNSYDIINDSSSSILFFCFFELLFQLSRSCLAATQTAIRLNGCQIIVRPQTRVSVGGNIVSKNLIFLHNRRTVSEELEFLTGIFDSHVNLSSGLEADLLVDFSLLCVCKFLNRVSTVWVISL